MALKDWKRIHTSNYEGLYRKNNKQITLTDNQTQLVHLHNPWHLTIETINPWVEILYQNFETEEKAVTFARKYMEKH